MDIPGNIRALADHLRRGCETKGYPMPRVLLEPGRSIVANAGLTLYRVGGVKTIAGYRSYVTVNGGMTDNPRLCPLPGPLHGPPGQPDGGDKRFSVHRGRAVLRERGPDSGEGLSAAAGAG